MAQAAITATFQLVGDNFDHAWHFNRFRCDPLGHSVLVTTALVSEAGGMLAVNGFVLSQADLKHNRERSLNYLSELNAEKDDAIGSQLLSVSPARVYPVNHMNLARMDNVGEIGLYRYSIHTLLTTAGPHAPKQTEGKTIACYPVVLFRCDLSVQLALLKELFSS